MDEVERLISEATNPDYYPRLDRILELGQKRDLRAVEPLLWMLENDNEIMCVRRACIETLADIGDERAVPILLFIAERKDALGAEKNRDTSPEEVRRAAVRALGRFYRQTEIGVIVCDAAIRALIRLVENKNGVMDAASHILGQIPNSRLYLQEALERVSRNRNDREVRFALTRALCLQNGFPILGIIEVKDNVRQKELGKHAQPRRERVRV